MFFDRKQWLVEFIEEWSQMVSKCNWYTCTVCRIEFENDAILGAYEWIAVFLGVGIRIRWNHTRTELIDELVARVQKSKRATR